MNGLHYNLPAGGVEFGESVMDAVKREALEEASVEIEVGPVAFVHEYIDFTKTHPHGISLIFDCKVIDGSYAKLPEKPDPNQTDVKWIPLSELDTITLYPDMKKKIIDYAKNRTKNIEFIKEDEIEILSEGSLV